MKEVIIGIVPTSNYHDEKNIESYDDKYTFINLYGKRILDNGGIPVGILLNDEKIDYRILNMCDGFIIPGGKKICKFDYEIIDYAIKNNKPLLGICLGFQALAIYSKVMENKNITTYEEFEKEYEKLKKINGGNFLCSVKDSIHDNKVTYEEINYSHLVNIIDLSSNLYDIYNKHNLSVVSLHKYGAKDVGDSFKITAIAPDNIIEAIEHKNKNKFIIGMQWHPELKDDLIFKRLIKEAIKRKEEKNENDII